MTNNADLACLWILTAALYFGRGADDQIFKWMLIIAAVVTIYSALVCWPRTGRGGEGS